MSNPFHIEITDEMIAQLPEKERGPWEQVRAGQKYQEELIANLLDEGNLDQALCLVGSEKRAALIVEHGHKLDDTALTSLLSDFWSVTEAWSGEPKLREGMLALLKRVAPLYCPPEPRPFTGTLTIYRGNLGEDATLGHSWTLDRKIAERFARMAMSPRGMFLGMYREDGVPSVWRANVPADKILGYFDDRDEQEIVVDPSTLMTIELIAQAVPTEES